jgi:hypothetical protein
MKHANDNARIQVSDFPDTPEGLAARRAWLESAPATHANNREVGPVETWCKREKDERAASSSNFRIWIARCWTSARSN